MDLSYNTIEPVELRLERSLSDYRVQQATVCILVLQTWYPSVTPACDASEHLSERGRSLPRVLQLEYAVFLN